ncbi:MAG TPA: hypothetical protein VFH23_07450 [Jiangellaceae bacterium]|jgi:hypothetical protein|nr:hypothetical protein [Jiangellaceae bacterium]
MSSTLEPPPRLLDGLPGTFAVLALPWGEPASAEHEAAGRTYRRGDVPLPLQPAKLVANFNHSNELAGVVVRSATTPGCGAPSSSAGERARSSRRVTWPCPRRSTKPEA